MPAGFVFRAANGDWYAVNGDGEQSPSFTSRAAAETYLGEPAPAFDVDPWHDPRGEAIIGFAIRRRSTGEVVDFVAVEWLAASTIADGQPLPLGDTGHPAGDWILYVLTANPPGAGAYGPFPDPRAAWRWGVANHRTEETTGGVAPLTHVEVTA